MAEKPECYEFHVKERERIGQLESVVESLRAQNRSLSNAYAQAGKEIQALETKVANLSFEAHSGRMEAVEAERRLHERELEHTRQQMSEARAQWAIEREKLKQCIAQLEYDVEKSRAQVKMQAIFDRQEGDKRVDAHAKLQGTIEELREHLKERQEGYKVAQRRLQSEIVALRKQVEAVQEEKEQVEHKLKAQEKALEEMSSRPQKLEKLNELLKVQVALKNKEHEALLKHTREREQAAHEQRAQLKGQLDKLQEEVDGKDATIEALRGQIDGLRRRLAEAGRARSDVKVSTLETPNVATEDPWSVAVEVRTSKTTTSRYGGGLAAYARQQGHVYKGSRQGMGRAGKEAEGIRHVGRGKYGEEREEEAKKEEEEGEQVMGSTRKQAAVMRKPKTMAEGHLPLIGSGGVVDMGDMLFREPQKRKKRGGRGRRRGGYREQ